jgi:NAD-reducing hydrogenase large subunit
VAKDHHLSGKEITEGLLNHVEVAIRAYDPCLSCATHAMGQMPLIVKTSSTESRDITRFVNACTTSQTDESLPPQG